MKKNIIISLIALCVSSFACGQTPNPVEQGLYIEYNNNKEKKPVKITLKAINDNTSQTEWIVKEDTAIIKTDKELNLGKIYHNTGKSVQFKVKENDDSAPINESSTNHTDQPLTVKTGNTYDFYNGGNKPFLTIIVEGETPSTYDSTLLSADSLKIGKDTLIKKREEKVKATTPSGIPTWVTISLAILALLIFIALLIALRRERVLQSNAKLMDEDIEAAEKLLSKIQDTFSPKEKTTKEEDDQKENNPEKPHAPTDSNNPTGNHPSKEGFFMRLATRARVLFSSASVFWFGIQRVLATSITKNISKLRELFTIPEKYNSKKFPQSKGCIINNTIPTFIADFQEKENEIENANRIIDVILAGNKEEEETTRKELVKDEGKANEIVKRILNLKDELIKVSKTETSEDKDTVAKWKAVEELLKQDQSQKRIEHLFGEDSKYENYAKKLIGIQNNHKRNSGKKSCKSNTPLDHTRSNYALNVLDKFLKKDLLNNILYKIRVDNTNDKDKDADKEILNNWILEQLKQSTLFKDVNQTQEKEWITYLEDKFKKQRELTEDQKNEIINKEIDKELKKNVGDSPVLKKIRDKLIDSLAKNNLIKDELLKDNVTIQSFATLLNSIPQSDDEMKEKGAKEIFNLLKEELSIPWEVNRKTIKDAIQTYYDNRVDTDVDKIIKRPAYDKIVKKQEKKAQETGEKNILGNLKTELKEIVSGNKLEANIIPNEIQTNGIKKALNVVFDKWHQKKEEDSLKENKQKLLENTDFRDALKDVCSEINSFDFLINILAEFARQDKIIIEQQTTKSRILEAELQTKQQQHAIELESAELQKQTALNKQKIEFENIIQEEKKGREQDNKKWQEINEANISTIKEYHLTELTRLRRTMANVDDQLRSAYNNFDRHTPLGKLIDSSIRENIYYSFDKFLRKIEDICGEDTKMSASMLADNLRGLYKECLSLQRPTWIDVLTRLYCYTDVPFIAENFEKKNLNCQSIRQAFFQMKNLLSDIDISITYPRLFRDKLNNNYEVKPERNIDDYVTGLADHITDRQIIIDLFTVGFQIADEEPRKPVVSIF